MTSESEAWSNGQFYCDVHKGIENGRYFTILGFFNKHKLIERHYQICQKCMGKFSK